MDDKELTIKEADALRSTADRYRAEADAHEREATEKYKLAADLEAQAVELLVPFKRGDVVEYLDTVGYSGKKITKRLKISHLRFTHSGIYVGGQRVNKQGDLGNRDSVTVYENKTDKVTIVATA